MWPSLAATGDGIARRPDGSTCDPAGVERSLAEGSSNGALTRTLLAYAAADREGGRREAAASRVLPACGRLASVEVEAPAVDELVSAAAAAVSTRLSDVTDDLVELIMREIPPLRDDARIESLLAASVAENVATLLHMFEHGIDPQSIEAPAAAVEYARRLAQRGVPLAALVRAYRIGHARFLRWCFEELKHEAADAPVAGEATGRMTELSFVMRGCRWCGPTSASRSGWCGPTTAPSRC